VWLDNEECDDGNMDDTDDCVGMCMMPVCGDGFVWAGNEGCDDGNLDNDDGCSDTCQPESCWSFTNTDQEDLVGGVPGAGWFDPCVDAVGDNVEITIRDENDMIVYQAQGAKVGVWTYDNLTSTNANQYDVVNHDRVISLDNGDLLRISGKSANNGGCGGSQGNGYVIMTYDDPINSTYYNNIKLLVAPYRHTVSNNNLRSFGDWTADDEISWNDDMNQFSCFPFFGGGPALNGFLGSASVRVF
jgi:cysteine-rich repeat protein